MNGDEEALCKEICYQNYESDSEICRHRRGDAFVKAMCWLWAETKMTECIEDCNIRYPSSPFCRMPFPTPYPIPIFPEPLPIPIPI